MGTDGLVDHLGEEFADFELVGLGGSGRVYRARQVTLGRSVAVKVLRSPVIGEHVDAVDEAKAQAAVSWHANVLTIHAHGVSPDGWAYLVLEDAEGGSLKARVDKAGPLSPDETLEMLGQLASALAAAHEIGVVHCDVKPSNVLFAKDGSVRLADFGTALSSTTQTLDFLEGSLVFAPPELLEGRRPGPANDVYGVAVTTLYALSGEIPFGGAGQPAAAVIARIHSEDVDFSGLGLPDVVAALLDRCGAKDPRDRPAAEVIAGVLQEWRTSGFGATDAPSRQSSRHNELRVALRKSLADRSAVMHRIAALATTGSSAVELARSLIQDLAWESAQAIKPLVDLAARDCPDIGGRTLSLEQLHHLVVSQTAAELAGHPSIHGDGILSMSGAAVPAELMHVAETLNTVMYWAARQCPDVAIDMGPIHRERSTALLAAFVDPDFQEEFFADPASADVFDAATLAIMLSTARNLFELLLTGHWSWFFAALDRRADLRQMVCFDHPYLILDGLAADPSLVPFVVERGWERELQFGVSRLTSSERAGVRLRYESLLDDIGLAL